MDSQLEEKTKKVVQALATKIKIKEILHSHSGWWESYATNEEVALVKLAEELNNAT